MSEPDPIARAAERVAALEFDCASKEQLEKVLRRELAPLLARNAALTEALDKARATLRSIRQFSDPEFQAIIDKALSGEGK